MTRCTFDGNTAVRYGGAIYNKGAMVVSGSTIERNSANSSGGGFYNKGSILAIMSTHAEGNSAELYGGGAIYVEAGVVDADGLIAEHNKSAEEGGAIYISNGSLYLSNSMIDNNKAVSNAGAILVQATGQLYIEGLVRVIDNDALMSKNILLEKGATIELSGKVNSLSTVDFAMEDIHDPVTGHFNSELCDIRVFSYNEAGGEGFPFYQKVEDDVSELYVDIDLWNQKLGAILITDWEMLKEYLTRHHGDDSGEKLEIALANDIYADGGDAIVTQDVILDLNGFTLDRQLGGDYRQGGAVLNIRECVDIVIKDGVGTGRITGGHSFRGGGLWIAEGAKVTFEGGTIYQNSAEKGGGIWVDGELEMTGGGILENEAKYDGGAISSQDGIVNVSNATIAYNQANDRGGAIFLNIDPPVIERIDSSTFRNCEILYNSSVNGGGAAFYMSRNSELYIVDCIINHNESGKEGGAIYIDEGDIRISGDRTEICYNTAGDDGGAIYIDERKVVVTGTAKICYNHTDGDGGAIYSEGIFDVDGRVEICYNDADEGGAIYINDGSTVNIRSGTTISYNTAVGNGGAIYVDDDGNINLWGGTITYNSADNGGGVYMDGDSDDIAVSGDLIVMYNVAIDGPGIYLSEDNYLEVDGPLADSASILVASENEVGKFTKGYSKHNGDKAPSAFFISSEGLLVILDDGEAALMANRTGSIGNEENFIGWESQIADYSSISDKNWMSGISGDRRLNEINIPGTHDSGMRSTKCHFNASIGDFAHMSKMAQTQALYIDEQLNAGARTFDIRINNQHLVPYDGWNPWAYVVGLMWSSLTWSDGRPYELKDDGENLWICHGKSATGGTFYARDHDGDDLTVNQVLAWMMNFLVLHPTETLIVGFSAEVQGDDEENVKITNDRIVKIIGEMYDEINPSTGKPFIYRVGDSPLGTPLTEYPYLKDVRGQIVLYENPLLGGIVSDNIGDVTESYAQDVGYDCSIDDKRQSVYRFFAQHVNEVDLPKDVVTHLTVRHSIGMNVGPTDTMYYIGKYFQSFYDHDIGPMHNARVLLGEFFVDGGAFDQKGKYVGWVKTDGAKAEHYAYVWKSNFPDDLNYATVTVESGLGDYDKQTYQLLLGTRITLPGCIYSDVGDLIFDGWKVGDTLYAPGTEYVVSEDVTFIANWRNTDVYCITFVNYDDTLLEVFHYNQGTAAQDIVDQAPSPSRPSDAEYTYTFAGWDPAVTDAVADATYKAVYDSVLNTYTVTWMTYDGVNVIETDANVDYGAFPSYNGPEQTREETEQHTYKFIGWSEDVDSESGVPVEQLPAVTGNVTYYASFMKVIKKFTVTFINWDDSVYFQGEFAIETEPNMFVPIDDPTRPPEAFHYYEFSGWSPEPSMLMEDTKYRAEFERTTELRYSVKFMDWDATILSEKKYKAGTSYSDISVPEDPSRPPTEEFSYTFKGWSPEVPTSGELTDNVVFAATYDYTVNQYTIRFINWDGTVLSERLYDFGTSPDDIVRPEDPTRAPDQHYTYDFIGWTPSITEVMTDETYQAVYSGTVRTYTITWKNYDGNILETTTAAYGDIPIYDGKVPTRPDSEAETFTFQGWSPDLQFVSGDAEYTATFFGVGLVFSITYIPNGGHFTDPEHQGHESYQHGYEWPLYNSEGYGQQGLVARDGYVFSWWIDSDGNRVNSIPEDAYGDITLYATWLALPYYIHYQIDAEGHFEHREYTIESETFTLPHPEIEGHTFVAWTQILVQDPEWLPDVTVEKGSTGTRAYEAHWEPNVYEIEYYDGDTKLDLDPATYTYGKKDAIAAQPAKEGYIKSGWFTTSDFQEDTQIQYYVPEKTLGDLKLYAKYDAQQGAYWETYPESLDLIYTSEEQTLISPGNAVGGTAYYRVGSGEYSTSLPKAINAREYRVDYKIVDSNGNDVDAGWIFATIGKAQSDFISHPVLKGGPFVFNDEDIYPIEEDGVVSGGSTKYSLDGEKFSYTWSSLHVFDAGEYAIYYKIVGDGNHHDSETYHLDLTVEKMDPECIPPVANELEYTGEAQVLTTNASAGSCIVLYSLDQENWSESVPSATNAGAYTVYYRCAEDRNHKGTEPASVQAEIYKADPTWTVTPCSYDYGYNGHLQPLIILAFPQGGKAVYRLDPSEEYSTNIPMVIDVGEYTVYYMIAGDSNHNDGAEGSVKATISKGEIRPEVSIENWTIGDAPSVPVVSGNPGGGAVTYEYKAVTAEESAYSGTVPTTVGNYNIRATVSETDNYLGGCAVSTFSITKKPLHLTLTIESWTYGEEAKAPTLSGNVGGGDVSIMYKLRDVSDIGYIYAVPIEAGLYTVRAIVSETEVYQSATVTANFEIKKATISPTVTIEGWTYGEEANEPSVSGNPGSGKVTYMYKLKGASEGSYTADVPVNAGSYTVKATVAETDNYLGGTATADFTIAKASISPTVSIEGWTYGQEAKAPSVTGNPGSGKVTYMYKVKDASEETYTSDVPVNAGSYTVKATVAETDNYLGSTATADFKIEKAAISPAVSIKGWTFGETANEPSVSGNPGDGAVSYLYKPKEAADEKYTPDVPVNTGQYTVKATVAETDNYLGGVATTDFSIAKAPISPVVTIKNWTFGQEPKAPTVSGNPGDGKVTYMYKVKGASEETYTSDVPVNAGSYTVKAIVAETDNYLGGSATTDFKIEKAPISPTVSIKGWTYGEKANEPSVSGNPGDGKVTYMYKLKEAAEEKYTPDVPVDAGQYTVKATVAETDNYLGGIATADFSIEKAAISPAVSIKGWTFGEKANEPSVSGNPGDGAVSYLYKPKEAAEEKYTPDVPTNAGRYTLKAIVAETQNYLGGTATTDFTIAKASISPTVSIEGWTYGEEAKAPSVSGNPGDGKVTFMYKPKESSEEAYTADVPVNAGSYTVKATVAETDNYLGGTATADFSIAKAPISPVVTIDGWTYGEEANEPSVSGNPGDGEVTYLYKLKEAAEETYTPDIPVDAGQYTVKATVAETDNYLGGTATADFSIAKAPITPTVTIEGWKYGDEPNAPSVSGNPGDGKVTYMYKVKDAPEETYTDKIPVDAGSYTVKATIAETDNYLGGVATADFMIGKAPISPVVTIEGWTYGEAANEPSVSGNPGDGEVTYLYKLKEAPEDTYTPDIPVNAGLYTVKATVAETEDYLGGTATADFRIEKAPISPTVSIEGWTYGEEANEPSVSGNPGDGKVTYMYKVKDAPEEAYTSDVPVDAGSYAVKATVAETDNYLGGTATADFSIAKAPISPVVTIEGWTYGEEANEPSVSGNPGDGQVTYLYKVKDASEETYTSDVPVDAGLYTVKAIVAETDNYLGGTATADFSIAKAPISPTVSIEGWTYGEEANAPSVSGNPGDGAVTYMYKLKEASEDSYTTEVPVNAGLYTVKAIVAETDNYLGGTATADFRIAKAPISPSVSIEGWTYGEEPNAPSVSGNPGDGDVAFMYKLKEASESTYTTDVPVDAGLYTVKAIVEETDNYLGGVATADFWIAKAPISPTVTIEGWTYGEEANEPSVSGNPGDGYVEFMYKLKEASESTYTTDVPVDAGLYTVKAIVEETDNYLGGVATADFMIEKAPISPTVTITDWTYGEEANEPSVSGNPGDGDVEFMYKLKEASESSYTTDVPVDAGLYTVKAVVAETENYLGGVATADFSIAKAPISPVVTIEGWTYGEEANEPSVSGNPGDGKVTFMYKLKEASESSYTTDVPVDAGLYTVKAIVAETDNYLGGTATADFRIAKATITPTVTIAGWDYGQEPSEPSVSGNPGDGKVTFMYKVKDAPESTYTTDVPVEVGSYTLKAIVAETDNYLGGTATADFDIDKAAISPTVTIKGWEYVDDPNAPSVSGNPGGGKVSYMYKLRKAPESAYTDKVPINAGLYTVKATVAETKNYLGGTATADFNISRSTAVVTADSFSKVYGSGDPRFTAVVSGLKAGDPESLISYSLSRTAGENVGIYTISVSARPTDNYDVATVSGTLEITKKVAIVDADAAFKTEGDKDPELTYKVYGLIPGDTLEGIELARTPGEKVGLYTVYFASQPVNDNYDITCHNGMFFITSKPVAEKHADGTITYTSQDDYRVDENTTISILIIETTDKDGNLLSFEYSQSLEVKDIDEHGNERVTITTAATQEIELGGGKKRIIDTDETKVVTMEPDAEGKDILTAVTSSLITDNNAGAITVTEKCKVEDYRMVTEAVSVVGDMTVTVTTTVLNKDAGDTVSLIDVRNAERQTAICLKHIEDASLVDQTMVVPTGERPMLKVDNDAFALIADNGMAFTVTSDCGSISYSSDVAAVFAGYDKPIVLQMRSGTYDSLNDLQKKAVPAGSLVLTVTAVSGGTEIKALGGDFTMTFPYDAPKGWDRFDVFYLDKEGVLHRERTEYKDGMLSITMDHHSDVAVLRTYAVELFQQGEGEVSADPSSARAGETVVLRAVPSEGFEFDGWETDPEIAISADGTFTMPSGDVAVLVKFKRIGPEPVPAVQSITVYSGPARTSYTEGERFDPTGLILAVTYDDGTKAAVSYAGNEHSFSFEPSIIKTLKRTDSAVKVIYGGATCEVSISVKSGDPFADNAVLICCIVIALVAIAAIAVFLIRRKGN
jgi:predicted outer membrane repeat protein